MRILLCVGALCCGALAQSPPARKTLTARELFYATADQTPAAAKPASAPAKAIATPAPKPQPPKPRPAARKKSADPPPQPEPEQAPAPVARPASGGRVVADPGEMALVRPAAHGTRERRPALGLRYTVLKLADGRMVEAAPDEVFRAGDRIQLSVEVNDAGHLYIIHQGSSGAWKPMFPSGEVEDGNNRVQPGRTYVLPPGSRFYFDQQPGDERLFVVLSREPVADLERLIYSLEGGAKPAPAAQPSAEPPKRLLLASSLPSIEDALVGRLRTAYARDLVIEKINDDAGAPKQEKAVYVVNPTGSPDSRVVADIRLAHR